VHVQNFAGVISSSGAGPPDDGPIVIDDDDEIMHEVQSDAKSMSIRDLKEELKKRGIDTSGCVEKADLVAKLEDHEEAVKDGKHDDQLSDYRARHKEQHNSNGAMMMAAQEVVATNESGGSAGGGSSGGNPIASGDGVGARMMGQMGYTGGGLGSNGQGIQEPIQARPREGRAGLGGENVGLELDDYQKAAFDACMASKNVFLTGRGGSGKTFLLKVTNAPPVRMVGVSLPCRILLHCFLAELKVQGSKFAFCNDILPAWQADPDRGAQEEARRKQIRRLCLRTDWRRSAVDQWADPSQPGRLWGADQEGRHEKNVERCHQEKVEADEGVGEANQPVFSSTVGSRLKCRSAR
jgi:hypothetical protein